MKAYAAVLLVAVALTLFTRGTSARNCELAKTNCLAALEKNETCEPLPFPKPPTVRPQGYNLEILRPGVYAVSNGVFYFLIIKKNKRLMIVDFPAGGFEIRDDVGEIVSTLVSDAVIEVLDGAKPVRVDMVYSHEHTDHIGTAGFVYDFLRKTFPKAKLVVWSSKGSAQEITEITSVKLPRVTRTIRKEKVFGLGGLNVTAKVVGGHTENDLLIYIPRSRGQKAIAFLVDVIIPGFAIPFRFALTKDIHEYLAVHKRLLSLDIDVFIGGHLQRFGNKQDIRVNLKYAESLLDSVRNASAKFSFPFVTALVDGLPGGKNFGNVFLVVGTVDKLVARQCTIDMVKKWGCVLPGVEVVAPDSCSAARFFFQIDT